MLGFLHLMTQSAGLSVLQLYFVSPRLASDYRSRPTQLFETALGFTNAASTDPALIGNLESLFFDGEDVTAGERILAAIAYVHPSYGKPGGLALPGSRRAFKG